MAKKSKENLIRMITMVDVADEISRYSYDRFEGTQCVFYSFSEWLYSERFSVEVVAEQYILVWLKNFFD